MKDNVTIKVFQRDWIAGFAGFANYEDHEESDNAHVVLNLGSLLTMVNEEDCEKKDIPYIVAECLMHEIMHVLERWASVEFNEERIEALLDKYREKYADVQD